MHRLYVLLYLNKASAELLLVMHFFLHCSPNARRIQL